MHSNTIFFIAHQNEQYDMAFTSEPRTWHHFSRVWGLAKTPRLGKELGIILHQLIAAIMTQVSPKPTG